MGRWVPGQAAIVGIGETAYYKRGKSPDPPFKLALEAILAAVEDAGIEAHEIDGFCTFADETSEPPRIAAALNLPELRFSNIVFAGGGGGGAAALGNAVAAVVTGLAECVVVYRSITSGHFRRGGGTASATVQGDRAYWYPYGLISPAQMFAMKVNRFMHDHGIGSEALFAIAKASNYHAQLNPRAVMYGKPLTEGAYTNSRWIVEPHHRLFDCCMENDGATAVIVVSRERARSMKQKPAYVLAAAQGSDRRGSASVHNAPHYASASFRQMGKRLFDMAALTPADIDNAQIYENFTGGVLMAMIEHGLFEPEDANDFLQPHNLMAPGGILPLNTSGGNLAECYMHGMEQQVEAVRQLRGQSTAQVPNARASLIVSGPMVSPTSNVILGTAEACP